METSRNSSEADDSVPPLKILLVEDEQDIAAPIEQALTDEGHFVCFVENGAQALDRLNSQPYDLVISDIRLPKVDGLTLFDWILGKFPSMPVILMTSYGTIPEAVFALQKKAAHYLSKPFQLDELLGIVEYLAHQHALQSSFQKAKTEGRETTAQLEIIGESPTMCMLKERVRMFSESDAPVLIQGESGTGKELVARALHRNSARCNGPFVAINCAAFPETLFEAELFGYERGAFTGAIKRQEGRFRAAHGGTILLDEVFDMPLTSQAKLLRVLQENVIQPLGSSMDIEVDVRVLSATNADLRGCVEEGRFREDLFYRLKVLELRLPPIRKRKGDLPLLVGYLLSKFSRKGEAIPSISARAWAALRQYPFPGNVRELEHTIRHALILSHNNEIDLEHLPDEIRGQHPLLPSEKEQISSLREALDEYEREYILRTLDSTDWNRQQTADLLGISRKNLWQKMKRHGIPSDGEQ